MPPPLPSRFSTAQKDSRKGRDEQFLIRYCLIENVKNYQNNHLKKCQAKTILVRLLVCQSTKKYCKFIGMDLSAS